MNQPWECPRCHVMNAPFIAHCYCKPNPQQQSPTLEEANKAARGEAPFARMTLPDGIPHSPKPWNDTIGTIWPPTHQKCLNCGSYHGNGVQCINLKVTA